MKIHEYQAQALFQKFGIATQQGICITNASKAKAAAEKLGGNLFVVKAQVHSGGRGKAGGVKVARTPSEAEAIAKDMLGMKLVTKQTGPEGKRVHKVLIAPGLSIQKEFYLSVAVDHDNAGFIVVASGAGGTEIEETAEKNPELIVKQCIDVNNDFKPYHARYIARKIGIPAEHVRNFTCMLMNMYTLLIEKECSLVEINPLIIDGENRLLALDGKINFDDNAVFRHPDIQKLRDLKEENKKEIEAGKYDLSYIPLDGNIGCMVNGAGLAMATMDIIHAYGGSPANFLDVGGSASADKVKAAFKILLSDRQVKAILVNIFGGIMKCDVIAEGIVAAGKEINIKVPLIVRLDGTNVEQGKAILSKSGLKITTADNMADAAFESVKQAKGRGGKR